MKKLILCCTITLTAPFNAYSDTITQTLQEVNSVVNQEIRYKPDKEDVWQSPEQTLKLKTGDCEDYAILKAYKLVKKGFNTDNMQYVTGVYRSYNSGKLTKDWHVYLKVTHEGRDYYLDNNNNSINIKPFSDSDTFKTTSI